MSSQNITLQSLWCIFPAWFQKSILAFSQVFVSTIPSLTRRWKPQTQVQACPHERVIQGSLLVATWPRWWKTVVIAPWEPQVGRVFGILRPHQQKGSASLSCTPCFPKWKILSSQPLSTDFKVFTNFSLTLIPNDEARSCLPKGKYHVIFCSHGQK